MPVPVVSILETAQYGEEVLRAADLLSRGRLVVLPTETVYGAAGLLTRPESRSALRGLRTSAERKPFTIHLSRGEEALEYLDEPNEFARRMMKKLWPGPVGLQFDVSAKRRQDVAKKLQVEEADLYEQGAIILRWPDHLVFSDVATRAGGPVVLTAAGSGHGAGSELAEELEGKVDLILDAGPSRFSKPSTLVHVRPDHYEIVRPGVYDERIIDKMLKTTILFVCSGNTCRSPMSEAIARHLLAEQLNVAEGELERKGINVISAGAFAMPGSRATPQAVEAVKSVGADLSRHRSRPLTVELIHQADAIYVMSRGHGRAVATMVPSAADKIATLDPEKDVDDPIGGDQALYTELAGQLRTLIERRLREQTLP